MNKLVGFESKRFNQVLERVCKTSRKTSKCLTDLKSSEFMELNNTLCQPIDSNYKLDDFVKMPKFVRADMINVKDIYKKFMKFCSIISENDLLELSNIVLKDIDSTKSSEKLLNSYVVHRAINFSKNEPIDYYYIFCLAIKETVNLLENDV